MEEQMETPGKGAFWSYAHEDDARSYGRVLKLADAIKNEYGLASAEELELFVDRDGVRWGDIWRSRIDDALGETPFFIAVITPTYLKSVECRRELISFSGRAKSRGLDPLLLPILYIDVPDLSEESSDEVAALVARTQYADWRGLRNKKLDSEEHMDAVQALAAELIKRQRDIASITLTAENQSPAQTVEELERTVAEIQEKLTPWMESVEFDQLAGAQWSAAMRVRLDRVNRLLDQRSSQSAIFSTLIHLGKELLPIASDRLDKAQSYAKLSIELDPLVDRAIRLASAHPTHVDLLARLRDGVGEAWINMAPSMTGEYSFGFPPDIIQHNKHLEVADELMTLSYTHVGEANKLVENWRNGLRALEGLPPEYVIRDDEGKLQISNDPSLSVYTSRT